MSGSSSTTKMLGFTGVFYRRPYSVPSTRYQVAGDWVRFSSDINNWGRHQTTKGTKVHEGKVGSTHSEMIRLAALSRWKRLSNGMTVVALYSVTMAGPEWCLLGMSSSLE